MSIDRNVKYCPGHEDKAKAEGLTLYTIDMRGPLAGGTATMQGFLFTKEEAEEFWTLIKKLGTRKKPKARRPNRKAPEER